MHLVHLQRGTTFVELIISIVVISVAVTGVLLVIMRNTASSADPLVQHQAIAIAEAYIEEIVEKPFVDPDGGEPEASRSLYDDIDDYNVISNEDPTDQAGNLIADLDKYSVSVDVVNEAVGPAGNQAPAGDTYRITVTVTTPGGDVIPVSAYRTNF